MDRTYTIYAGVNGAGKSTMYKSIKLNPGEERVNADEILVEGGGDWRDEKDQADAMREAVKRINYFINEGVSFNQETTLTGRSIFNTIKKTKRNKFYVRLVYIGLEDANLAVDRVKNRVKLGGHGIDEITVRRRYDVSLSMLEEVLPLCDIAVIYDNSEKFHMVAKHVYGELKIFDKDCNWFNKALRVKKR